MLERKDEALDTKDEPEAPPSRKRSAEPETEPPAKRPRGSPPKQPRATAKSKANIAVHIINLDPEGEQSPTLPNSEDHDEPPPERQNGNQEPADEIVMDFNSAPQNANHEELTSPSTINGESDEIIVPNITLPTALTLKMLEVDGRVKPTNGNAWKEIRCFRDNQDMGTLWEVRQAWYLKTQIR
jgi:hypothetical protein